MSEKNYLISKELLIELMNCANEMLSVATLLQDEYNQETNGDFKKQILSEGILHRLDKRYMEMYQIINIVCNDDTINGKIKGECK